MVSQTEVREGHHLFCAAWSRYARCSDIGEVVHTDGLQLANARQSWFLMNAAVLTDPVSSQTYLEARAHAAIDYFRTESNPWFFCGSRQWLGEGATETLARLGLTKAVTTVGMVAEELATPSQPLPKVDTRRIDDEQGRLALADLNANAYDVPTDWVRAAVAGESLWQSPLYGYVAYVDGHPVSTAFAMPIHDVLYVAFVATANDFRRRGFAELVMRRSLEEATEATGRSRTALHATAAGYSVYRRMGYRPVDEFLIYVPS